MNKQPSRFFLVWAVALAVSGCGRDRIVGPDGDADMGEFDASSVDTEAFLKMAQLRDLDEFARVDRMGMPAVATAVIMSKNAYNQADPTDDAAGAFVSEIVASVAALHGALDDDLTGAGLTPCATADCVGQAAPFVVPDVVRIDPSRAAGFPNGRRLTDPVIDVTLALVLLDLGTHPVTALLGLNPTANDLPFGAKFPYLAPPQPGL